MNELGLSRLLGFKCLERAIVEDLKVSKRIIYAPICNVGPTEARSNY